MILVAIKRQNSRFEIVLQFIVPIIFGHIEQQCRSFHLSTLHTRWEPLTIKQKKNNKKLQPVICSEQETGGQRKQLPSVRWYGFTNSRFHVFRKRKLSHLLRVLLNLMQNIGCHKHAITWYWGLPHARIETTFVSNAKYQFPNIWSVLLLFFFTLFTVCS